MIILTIRLVHMIRIFFSSLMEVRSQSEGHLSLQIKLDSSSFVAHVVNLCMPLWQSALIPSENGAF